MLYGVALGDALGAPHEFRYSLPLTTYTGQLKDRAKMCSRFQGTRYLVVGQVTDDTEMTLALLSSLSENKQYDKNKTILKYLEWANSGNCAMGNNTRGLMKGVKTLRGYSNRYDKAMNGTSKEMLNCKFYNTLIDVQSNGSLMRCSSLALLPKEELEHAVREDCSLTNPAPINLECSRIYLHALSEIIRRPDSETVDLSSIYDECRAKASIPEVLTVFQEIDSDTRRDVTVSKSWVVHALYTTMFVLRKMSLLQEVERDFSYSELIDEVIRMGGDTDTNGAITGAVIGAVRGYNGIYFEEVTRQNLSILFSARSDSGEGDFPRPEQYSPRQIDSLLNILLI